MKRRRHHDDCPYRRGRACTDAINTNCSVHGKLKCPFMDLCPVHEHDSNKYMRGLSADECGWNDPLETMGEIGHVKGLCSPIYWGIEGFLQTGPRDLIRALFCDIFGHES